ncbi:MAG: hypothetical protein JW993_00245 [Sedimentisphaerales bacterium]|nr:hypothetical protein [Sedimentisphaerales bacterium]
MLAVSSAVSAITEGDLGSVVGLVHTIANCAMMWHLLDGFMDLSLACQHLDLAEKAASRRVVYVTLSILAALIVVMAREGRDAAGIAAMALVVTMLVLLAMILHLIHQIRDIVAAHIG